MENELAVYEAHQAVIATNRTNYTVSAPNGASVTLKRDIDFGKYGQAQRPCLLKAGAEKICALYGLLQHYTIETKVEKTDIDDPFFFYSIRCDLVKVATDGTEYVFTSGLGSANSREKSNGRNGAFDAANAVLKKSAKRALVAAAVNIGGLSGAFYQDIEDTAFVENGYKTIANSQDPESTISAPQIKRLFAIANDAGYNAKQAKEVLAKNGVMDTKLIKQKDYDAVCKLFEVG